MRETGIHPSHGDHVRFSDARSCDLKCDKCGATDIVGSGWHQLAEPCGTLQIQEAEKQLIDAARNLKAAYEKYVGKPGPAICTRDDRDGSGVIVTDPYNFQSIRSKTNT